MEQWKVLEYSQLLQYIINSPSQETIMQSPVPVKGQANVGKPPTTTMLVNPQPPQRYIPPPFKMLPLPTPKYFLPMDHNMTQNTEYPGPHISMYSNPLMRKFTRLRLRPFRSRTIYPQVATHGPVLSTHNHGHILYTRFSFSEPGGNIVVCHRNCTQGLDYRPSKNNVTFMCEDCGSRCKTPIIKTDRTTVLGREALINTVYLQAQYPTEWRFLTPSDEANTPQPSFPLVVKPRAALKDKVGTKIRATTTKKVRAASTTNIKTSMASSQIPPPQTLRPE
jgi:hypothetical protein